MCSLLGEGPVVTHRRIYTHMHLHSCSYFTRRNTLNDSSHSNKLYIFTNSEKHDDSCTHGHKFKHTVEHTNMSAYTDVQVHMFTLKKINARIEARGYTFTHITTCIHYANAYSDNLPTSIHMVTNVHSRPNVHTFTHSQKVSHTSLTFMSWTTYSFTHESDYKLTHLQICSLQL